MDAALPHVDRAFVWDEFPLFFMGRYRVLYELTGSIDTASIRTCSRNFQNVITLETQERTDAEEICR
jgi:hypothetical protein